MAIGGWIGSLFGGPLGAILGAALGHQVEKQFGGGEGAPKVASMSSEQRAMIFSASAAAMLAKLAKADGRVTRSEIAEVENAFRRLGFSAATREYAIRAFRRAKDDGHSIFEYAREFAAAVGSVEVRELFYEILWDLAGADGVYSAEELAILRQVPRSLRIRLEWFAYFASQRLRSSGARPASAEVDPLAEAYAVLGASAADDGETLKRKYRELAKRNHPDALRSQGLPEEMVGKATERMSRINAAWARIRVARGL